MLSEPMMETRTLARMMIPVGPYFGYEFGYESGRFGQHAARPYIACCVTARWR